MAVTNNGQSVQTLQLVDVKKDSAVPDLEFNEVLWSGLKGTPFPGPRRAAFVKRKKVQKDDDDD